MRIKLFKTAQPQVSRNNEVMKLEEKRKNCSGPYYFFASVVLAYF